jgi:hypothetical protein
LLIHGFLPALLLRRRLLVGTAKWSELWCQSHHHGTVRANPLRSPWLAALTPLVFLPAVPRSP